MKTKNGFTLDKGDTPESELITGRKSLVMVHGRLLHRNFQAIECKFCGKIIQPYYVPCLKRNDHKYAKGHNYRLLSDSDLNGRANCDNTCRDAGLRLARQTQAAINDKAKSKTFNQQVKPWTKRQRANYLNYVLSL